MSRDQRTGRKIKKENKKSGSIAKIIPALVAIVLIIAVVWFSFGKQIIDKYSYSNERYDMTVYFENTSEHDVAIIMQDKFMGERAYLYDGTYYVDMDFVNTYLNNRFYFDSYENLLIYTLPLDMITVETGSDVAKGLNDTENLGYKATREEDGKLLVALDYVLKFSNYEYKAFTDPARIQMYTEWNEITTATVKKDTQVRHKGGVKEEILKDVKAGDKVTVIEQMDTWSKVKTDDAIIGFVENKFLNEGYVELPVPVSDYVEPEYTNLCRDHKINMGWHSIAGVAGNDTFNQAVSQTKGLNVISPTWFKLTDNVGNYDSYATQDYVDKAHKMGMEVWPTLDNIEHGSDVDMKEVLKRTSQRQDLISRLTNDILAMGIDGINIDIEMLPVEAGRDFSEFLRELSISCRQNGIVLSVDDYVPLGNTDYYDRKTQGEVCDYVVIMGYDEHYATSEETGSVASIGFVEKGIKKTLEEVPAQKIINGIPFYTRVWTTEGADITSAAMDMRNADEWIDVHGISLEWDDETCQYYGERTEGNKLYQVWKEDVESIKVKLSVMQANNIAGVAEWCLGYETPEVWDAIEEYLNQ